MENKRRKKRKKERKQLHSAGEAESRRGFSLFNDRGGGGGGGGGAGQVLVRTF